MSRGGVARGLGRPPKFPGPSRVVTMTLPEATLAALEALDADRARAVVRATDIALAEFPPDTERKVEMLAVTKNMAVIVVPFSRPLSDVRGVSLIQIMPSRYLVILDPGLPLSQVEVSIMDMLDSLPAEEAQDRAILTQMLDQLRSLRRADRAKIGEVILIAI